MFLYEPETVASILEKLLRSANKDDALMAFQIAFDLVENEHQAFLLHVRDRLPPPKSQPLEAQEPDSSGAEHAQNERQNESPATAAEAAGDVKMTDGTSASNENAREIDPSEAIYAERLTKIKGILSGETSIQLTLQFLYSHNK